MCAVLIVLSNSKLSKQRFTEKQSKQIAQLAMEAAIVEVQVILVIVMSGLRLVRNNHRTVRSLVRHLNSSDEVCM